jgi:hypothetical protein
MSESAQDKAIKRSSEDIPPFERPPSPKRLSGEDKDRVLALIDDSDLSVPQNYHVVHVVDFLGFNPDAFNYYLVNFFYEHDVDPRTRIISRRVYSNNKVTTA